MAALREMLESERDRWILWAPVALAAGIGIYFSLPAEPPAWLMGFLPLLGLLPLLVWRGRTGWPFLAGLFLILAGFSVAQSRTLSVAAPVLREPTGIFHLSGRVVAVEPVEKGQRVTLDHLSGGPLYREKLERVRLRLRADYGLRPGQEIALRAALMPPPAPSVPGGYDFTRAAWFQKLGAVGYAVGRPQIRADAPEPGWRTALGRARQELTGRIVGAIDRAGYAPGIGVVAAALITGQRGPVPPFILQSYRDAGLAHILVIAGMHLSMVAGLVLVVLRGLLAAIPPIALRYPIHKWTACGALMVTLGYLLISGAPVPTQRAFIMTSTLLLAVLLDRQPVSLRSISLAAMAVLLLQPEALMGPSFQLSFAAVYGLICGYEALGPWLAARRQSSKAWWQMPILYVGGILLTTQIAGTATAFYSLFHFNRYAVYGLLGNALAVPLVGFWVMPAALLAFCLMPFGLDDWGWRLMGAGLEQVTRIAVWVSHLPGATINLPSMPELALVLFSAGSAWLLLWRTRWRLYGLSGMAAALAVILLQTKPDLLIDQTGRLVAVKQADGRLHLASGRGANSLRQSWAQMAGEGERLPEPGAGSGAACSGQDCRLLRDGQERWITVPPSGGGTREIWLKEGEAPRIVSVADWQGDRPWRKWFINNP
ncbi:MAG TPA: ComEC/Rec2 family competence protein [Magnetospirillaceae bacterium]|nr:ComEC/Rec2 family competence protein [Magnetospirillaceae bacterium]